MNVRSLDELQKDTAIVLRELDRQREPVLITRAGKPGVVLLPQDVYEEMQHRLNLARLLFEAEEDARAGRTEPLAEAMEELRRGQRAAR